MKPKIILLLTFVFLLLSACGGFSSSEATIRYVSTTGSSTPPYLTWETAADSIQKAIDICVDGDSIIVANGTYYETLVINTQISLIGLSADSTIIDGRGMGDITITANSNIDLENFNIFGKGKNSGDAAIRNLQTVGISN